MGRRANCPTCGRFMYLTPDGWRCAHCDDKEDA